MGNSQPTDKSNVEAIHPFAGCDRTLKSYETIGKSLVGVERTSSAQVVERDFRIGVAFVSVEVLESYLEDLLDLEINDEYLSIFKEPAVVQLGHLSLAGVIGACALGIYAMSIGGSLGFSMLLTICVGVPFVVLWHFAPSEGMSRRMRFAQIVSREISRRRGIDRDEIGRTANKILFRELLTGEPAGSTQGAARSVFH